MALAMGRPVSRSQRMVVSRWLVMPIPAISSADTPDRAVPTELIFRVMEALEGVTLAAPVAVGQVVVENICGTGANAVATRNLPLLK